MKYKNNIEIGDMTDQQLEEAVYDMQWLLAHRENRLLDVKDRHKNFDFTKINPAFVQLQSEINNEIKVRKARG